MTRNLRLNSDEALPPSRESADNPHFFKIIHSTVLGDGKLMIPKKFVRMYGRVLSDTMFLKIPNGAVWKVGLTRDDDKVWFQNGWQEFAEYYSVGYGHFLVFGYEGDSAFRVLIFDTTASEIEYPSTTNDQHHQQPIPTMTGSVEIPDDLPAGDTPKENAPCLPERVEIESDVAVGMLEVPPTRESYRRVKNCVISRAVLPSTASKEVGALQKAGALKPGNPFFTVKMAPSYLGGSPPGIPLWFVKRHFRQRNNGITVWGRDGKTWAMNCRLRNAGYGRRKATFSSDWRIFVRDNKLKAGDVCAFELVKSPFILLKVVIFRNNEDAADGQLVVIEK